jgi:endonuclease/exonuclease/phosphatase family metal-dependent hydrolase
MRRIVSAIGPAIALVAASVPTTAHAAVPFAQDAHPQHSSADRAHHHSRASTALDTASSALGTAYVHVSWNWIKAATGYRIQISKRADFSRVEIAKSKSNSRHRPAGGREAAVIGKLRDATYYWVRVSKLKGHHASGWSAPVRVATKAHIPDKIYSGGGTRGHQAGETILRWKSAGHYTDYYRITTGLTPFGSHGLPANGRSSTTFRVSGKRHSYTMTPQQTAAAGAGIGSGHYLFFRITAVRNGEAYSASRPYQHLLHAGVKGMHSTGNGPKLRFAAYNIHLGSRDAPGHPWKNRQKLVAKNLAHARPDVVGLSEMVPTMWDNRDGGSGLHAWLKKVGMGSYRLTRTTGYFKNSPGDARILYNSRKVTLVGNCSDQSPSCYADLPSPDHPMEAPYALFRDNASGQQFYFMAAHLRPGNTASMDQLRSRQAQAMVDGIASVNRQNLPVVLASDSNSAQTSAGTDGPHVAWAQAGYYNTLSAAKVVNGSYNSVNHYESPERPSNYGFGAMYDTVMTLNMPGADLWKQVITRAPWPSDHNMVFADVRLP